MTAEYVGLQVKEQKSASKFLYIFANILVKTLIFK